MWHLSFLVLWITCPVADSILTLNTFLEVGLYDPVVLGTFTLRHLVVWYIRYLA